MSDNNRRTVGTAALDWQERGYIVQRLLDTYSSSLRFRNDLESLEQRCKPLLPIQRFRDEKLRNEELLSAHNRGKQPPPHATQTGDQLLIFASFNDLSDISCLGHEPELARLYDYVDLVVEFAGLWGLTVFPEGTDVVHDWIWSRQYYGVRYSGEHFGQMHGFHGPFPIAPELEPMHVFRPYPPSVWRPTFESRAAAEKRIANEEARRRRQEMDRIQEHFEAAGYKFADTQPTLNRNVTWLYHCISAEKKTFTELALESDPEVSPKTVQDVVGEMKKIIRNSPDYSA